MEDYAFFKRILIECSTTIKNQHPNVAAEMFETIGSKTYLRLLVDRRKYTAIEDELKTDYIFTGMGTIAPVGVSKRGFDAVCDYPDAEVLGLVRHLAKACTSANLRQFTPIEVLDFLAELDPIPANRRVLNGEFYTRWLGRIVSIQPKGFGVGFGSALYGEGFSLKFKQGDRSLSL